MHPDVITRVHLTAPLAVLLLFTLALPARATPFGQTPTATINGLVTDHSGAVIVGADITVRQTGTGFGRRLKTQADGRFRVENLQPGGYEVEAHSSGFRAMWRRLTLQIGDDATVNFELQPGLPDERVEVTADVPHVNTTDYSVSGVVSRTQIQELPLNGRNFLELAQLEPGVNVTSVSNPGIVGNSYQRVNIAGGFPVQTRIIADGSTVTDRFVGGTMLNFSQESVQEFQISTFNPDLAAGVTGAGVINIVTRRGSNDLHGSAFFFYRDHNLSAYPALVRSPRTPDPFFARRQTGVTAGGPLRRDRWFWFANYEHRNQDSAFAVTNNSPIFSKLDVIYPSPLDADPFNLRLDGRLTDAHQVFLRYSSDWNETLAPANPVGMPSNWQSVRNRGVQIQAGATSLLTSRMVNELRLAYTYLGGKLDPVSASQCTDPAACIGAGAANILVFDAPQFRIGTQATTPLHRWQRNYQLVEGVTRQSESHLLRFGGSGNTST